MIKVAELWQNTYTGAKFHAFDAHRQRFDLVDITHALSLQARFAGHTAFHYSVAHHSLLVGLIVAKAGGTVDDIVAGLLHDATEAYLVDLPSPIKRHPAMELYRQVEDQISRYLLAFFGLDERLPPIVHSADKTALAIEAATLLPNRRPEFTTVAVHPESCALYHLLTLPPRGRVDPIDVGCYLLDAIEIGLTPGTTPRQLRLAIWHMLCQLC